MNVLVVDTRSTFENKREAEEAKKEMIKVFGSFATKIWREKEAVRMTFYIENIIEQMVGRYAEDSDGIQNLNSGLMIEDMQKFILDPLEDTGFVSDMFEIWAYFKDDFED